MSHVHEGPLAGYNSLTDSHLAGYFANGRMRRHLRKAGLVSRHGQIVTESTYRLNMSRREHKKHVKDMLAQAIVYKTLDMERSRQAEIKKKLEEIAKIQLVRRVRDERSRQYEEALLPLMSSRSNRTRSPSPRHSRSQRTSKSQSMSSVSGKRDRVLYLDDEGHPITSSAFSDRRRSPEQNNIDTRHLHSLDSVALRKYAMLVAQMDEGRGLTSPYMMPQMPLPPRPPSSARTPRSFRRVQSASPRRTITTDSRLARLHRPETAKSHAGDQQTLCRVAMKYHGWALNLAREKTDHTQEVVIEQQHCGGNTLTVFKERLEPGTKFDFISYRHRGYPFSLSLYVDGQMDSRVSTCCEYRHSRGAKIGGKQGHFSLLRVSGAVPCYKCQVAKGVRKPSRASPKKLKRPAEVRREEVIVVSTRRHQEEEADDYYAQERFEPVEDEEEEDEVLVPVERDEHDSQDERDQTDSRLNRSAQSDDYADDFEDSQASSEKAKSSAPSSSSSESESEAESVTPKEEAYTLSVRNKERGQEEPRSDILPRDVAASLSSRPRSSRPRPKSATTAAAKGRLSQRADRDDRSPEQRAPFTDTITPCHSPSSSVRSSSSSVAQQEKPRRKKKSKASRPGKKPPPAEAQPSVPAATDTERVEDVKVEKESAERLHDEEREPAAEEEEELEKQSQTHEVEKQGETREGTFVDKTLADPGPASPAKAAETTAGDVAEPAGQQQQPPATSSSAAASAKDPERGLPASGAAEENPEVSTKPRPEEKGTTSSSVVAEATTRPDLHAEGDEQKTPLDKDHPQCPDKAPSPQPVTEEADTADEVSDIESEVVSPRRLDPNFHPASDLAGRASTAPPSTHSTGDSPRLTLSPRGQGRAKGHHHLADVSEREEEEDDKEEAAQSRGEEDVKNAYKAQSTEPRGREEAGSGTYVIVHTPHGTSRRKGGWKNDTYTKTHGSHTRQQRAAKRKDASSLDSRDTSNSATTSSYTATTTTTTTTSTEDDSYAGSSSNSGTLTASGSEHYSTLAQKDERAALSEEQEGDKRYTLSQPGKDSTIKRHKKKKDKQVGGDSSATKPDADNRTKKKESSTGRRRNPPDDHWKQTVDPAADFVMPPPDYDASRGKEQAESGVEEPEQVDGDVRQVKAIPQGDKVKAILQEDEVKATEDGRGDQEEAPVMDSGHSAAPQQPGPHRLHPFPDHLRGDDSFDNSEKREEEPGPVEDMPKIVISPTADTHGDDIRPPSGKDQHSTRSDGSSQSSSSSSSSDRTDSKAGPGRVQRTGLEETRANNETKENAERPSLLEEKPDGRSGQRDRDSQRDLQESPIDFVFTEPPDSPPSSKAEAEGDRAPDISISGARRLSAELGTGVEQVVLAHLRRLSAGSDEEGGARQRALTPDSDSVHSPGRRRLSGEMEEEERPNLERHRSSLSVPLDTGSLQLTDRWVTEEDLSRQSSQPEKDLAAPQPSHQLGKNSENNENGSVVTDRQTDSVFISQERPHQQNEVDAVTMDVKTEERTPAESDVLIVNSPCKRPCYSSGEDAAAGRSYPEESEAKNDAVEKEMEGGNEDVDLNDVNMEDVPSPEGTPAYSPSAEEAREGGPRVEKGAGGTGVTDTQNLADRNGDTFPSEVRAATPSPPPPPPREADSDNNTSASEIRAPSSPKPRDQPNSYPQHREINGSSSSLSSTESHTLPRSDSSSSSNPDTKHAITTRSEDQSEDAVVGGACGSPKSTDQSEDAVVGGACGSPSDLSSSPLPATPEEMARKQEALRAGQSTPLPQGRVLQDEELEALKQEVERDVSRPQDPSTGTGDLDLAALPGMTDLYVIHESENEASDVDRSGAYTKGDFGSTPASDIQQSLANQTSEEDPACPADTTKGDPNLESSAPLGPAEQRQTNVDGDHAAEGPPSTTPILTPPTILITNPDTDSSEDKSARLETSQQSS